MVAASGASEFMTFGCVARQGDLLEDISITWPDMAKSVGRVLGAHSGEVPPTPRQYSLGANAAALISNASTKMAHSGLLDHRVTTGGVGGGSPTLETGQVSLYGADIGGASYRMIVDARTATGPVADAIAAMQVLRDVGIKNGRASSGGAA